MRLPDAIRYILNSRGKFVSVEFVKRSDGSLRRMVCRTGVRKGLTGVGMAYSPTSKGLLTVWDRDAKAFRMIPVEGIVGLRIRGVYTPVGDAESSAAAPYAEPALRV